MSAWGNIEKPELVNFADIVSEEISRHLQAKKESSILDASNDGWTWIESDECNEDLHCTEENKNETSNLSHWDQNVPLINGKFLLHFTVGIINYLFKVIATCK